MALGTGLQAKALEGESTLNFLPRDNVMGYRKLCRASRRQRAARRRREARNGSPPAPVSLSSYERTKSKAPKH